MASLRARGFSRHCSNAASSASVSVRGSSARRFQPQRLLDRTGHLAGSFQANYPEIPKSCRLGERETVST